MESQLKSIPLQKFLGTIKEKGYSSTKIYSQGAQVKFILLCSNLQRKPFFLQVPNRFVIYNTDSDHMLEQIENNYKSFRQRDYLSKIDLPDVACLSKENLCIKNDHVNICYTLDTLAESSDDELDFPKEDGPLDGPSNNLSDSDTDDSISELSDDVSIDDYQVENIYPVYNMMFFIKNMDNFEDYVLQSYVTIVEAEEKMNEAEVERLLAIFDKQKKALKERIYKIHQEAYNTRRDISKAGANLQRIYLLRKKSEHEKDLVRFKIDRLAVETEDSIDSLNDKLREIRNTADSLLKKFYVYIEKFDNI